MLPNGTASFSVCHLLHLKFFLPRGSKHLNYLRGIYYIKKSSHTFFAMWIKTPRCILSWRVEGGVIWTFQEENKNIICLSMCLWGIGLKSQFRQLNTVIYPFHSVCRKKNYDSLPADIIKWSETTSTAANQKRKTILFLPKLHVSQVAFSTFLYLSLKLPLKNNRVITL